MLILAHITFTLFIVGEGGGVELIKVLPFLLGGRGGGVHWPTAVPSPMKIVARWRYRLTIKI